MWLEFSLHLLCQSIILQIHMFYTKLTIQLLFVLNFLGCLNFAFADSVALFYALDKDLEVIRKELISKTSHPVGGRTIHEFRGDGHHIFAVKMGSGCISTAVSVTSLLTKFQVDHAFSIGPAAGIANLTEVGTWYFVDTQTSYQIGSVKEGGFTPTGDTSVLRDPKIPGIRGASATSGERFIASTNERKRIASLSEAQLLEMNLEGLTQSTKSFGVPLISLRVISDLGDDEASDAFAAFITQYKGDGALLFLEWLNDLPPNLNSPDSYRNLKELFEGVDLGLGESTNGK